MEHLYGKYPLLAAPHHYLHQNHSALLAAANPFLLPYIIKYTPILHLLFPNPWPHL
jgi:hypothetical protein